jgi:ribonuclease E
MLIMAKKILVTASNPEETRVAVLEDNELTNYDSERLGKKPIKGNVYLAKVVRIEPSLQAVFIEYGGDKNGFLPFTEIHPDYYKVPVDDIDEPEGENAVSQDTQNQEDKNFEKSEDDIDQFAYPDTQTPDDLNISDKELENNSLKTKKGKKRHYNVQEVIHNKQVLLVQAIKDIRGNKCAAFTTYLSLPGQYCVLMPNSGGERSGGVSRRVNEDETRQRLKDVLKNLKIPDKMSLIIRTAGQERTKLEIRKDFEYLMRLWDEIRDKTLESNAPMLIHEEAAILMRVIRDFYKKDIDEILVDTQDAHKQIRVFMKQLSPSGVRKVKLYKDTNVSLFNSLDIEDKIIAMVSPRVPLPSGGSLVIGQTEALVAIDVNSGKATKERHIDTTALKTNLEAAKEIAKQLKLRDLSGLIVIDFIDMWESKHVKQVEQYFRAELATDRSRIQTGNISQFGLMEMSRQRLRSSVMEMYSERCPHCQGRGTRYSGDYFTSAVLSLLEKLADGAQKLVASVPPNISETLLNKRRKEICCIEEKYNCTITIRSDRNLNDEEFILDDGISEPSVLSLGKTLEEQEESKFVRNNGYGNNKKMDHDTKNKKDKKRGHSDTNERSAVNHSDSQPDNKSRHHHSKRTDDVLESEGPQGKSDLQVSKYVETVNLESVTETSSPLQNSNNKHTLENSKSVFLGDNANGESSGAHSKQKHVDENRQHIHGKERSQRLSSDEKPRYKRRNRSPYSLIQRDNQKSAPPQEKPEGSSDKKKTDKDENSERARRPDSVKLSHLENLEKPSRQSGAGQLRTDAATHAPSPFAKKELHTSDEKEKLLDGMNMMEPYRQKAGVTSTVRRVFGRLVGRKK